MSEKIEVDPRLIEAFNLMWGNYPAPASLVHRSKMIIAVNGACKLGGREPGMICAEWSSPDRHRGCLANQTLARQKPLSKKVRLDGRQYTVYWLPISGYPDFYVHFSTEIESEEE